MTTIADQVATIEHDLTAALAQIDQLKAANAAFDSANSALRRDNVALQLELNDMKHFVDDTRALADNLAVKTLEMLRASRRHVGPVVAAEEPEPTTLGGIDRATNPRWKNADVSLDARIAKLPETWPTQQAVAEIMANDSGDENVQREVDTFLRDTGISPSEAERADIVKTVEANAARPEPVRAALPMPDAFGNVRPMFG